MTFRAVIFDLGGVVLGSPLHVFRAYEMELGLAPEFLGRMISANGSSGAWLRLERGELDMASFIAAFDLEAAAAGATISGSELMARIATASRPCEPMLTAIRRLRSSGLRVAALTNNWLSDDQQQRMERLRSEFDAFVESAREGLRKPDPRIYALTCDRLGVTPAESVFLDDIGSNLKPARAMGMVTIKVDDPLVAIGELERVLGLSLL